MKENPYPGKLIVFEGIDGAGAETQTNLLFNYLKKQKILVEKLQYPDYKGPIGRLIYQFLHKRYDFSVETQFLLYLTDFVKDKEKIVEWLREGKVVISDRYFTSAIAYQGVKGFPIKRALDFAKILELPRPDILIFLKALPEISIKRKLKEKKHLDRHEIDENFLRKLAKFYEKLIRNKVFTHWIVINGEKSIKEVFNQIKLKIKIFK